MKLNIEISQKYLEYVKRLDDLKYGWIWEEEAEIISKIACLEGQKQFLEENKEKFESSEYQNKMFHINTEIARLISIPPIDRRNHSGIEWY